MSATKRSRKDEGEKEVVVSTAKKRKKQETPREALIKKLIEMNTNWCNKNKEIAKKNSDDSSSSSSSSSSSVGSSGGPALKMYEEHVEKIRKSPNVEVQLNLTHNSHGFNNFGRVIFASLSVYKKLKAPPDSHLLVNVSTTTNQQTGGTEETTVVKLVPLTDELKSKFTTSESDTDTDDEMFDEFNENDLITFASKDIICGDLKHNYDSAIQVQVCREFIVHLRSVGIRSTIDPMLAERIIKKMKRSVLPICNGSTYLANSKYFFFFMFLMLISLSNIYLFPFISFFFFTRCNGPN